MWWNLDIHGPWHLGFWPSLMTHLNISFSSFCVWFWPIWTASCVSESTCPTLLLLHRTLSWVRLCLSWFLVEWRMESVLQLFIVFLCFQKRVCTLLKININDLCVPSDPTLWCCYYISKILGTNLAWYIANGFHCLCQFCQFQLITNVWTVL